MALQDFPSAISPVGQAIQADPRVESDRQRLATMGTQLTQQEADASAMQRVLEESQRAAANREAQLTQDSIANLLSGMETMLTSEQRGMEWKLPGGEPARPEHLASGRVECIQN